MEQRGVSDAAAAYFRPSPDEETAIKKSIEILRDMEVRCIRAAIMGYMASNDNDIKHFRTKMLAGGTMALLAFPIATLTISDVTKFALEFFPDLGKSKYLQYFMGSLIGGGFAILMFKGIVETVFPIYKQKTKIHNEAAAEWQTLELQIRSFLAAAVNGRITSDDCRRFIDECSEKRKKICLIARPDQKIYKEIESSPDIIKKRKESLKKIHQKIIEGGLY